jgi:MFS family permease
LRRFRWVICALLLLGMTKNYMDRQVIGILKTTLQHQFAWSEIDYGNLVAAFQAAYALGLLFVGRFIDRLGTRVGYALAMAIWSLASITQGWMSSLIRRIPRFGEEHCRMVPEERARPGAGRRQCRNQPRRDHHAVACALDHLALGMALVIFFDRQYRFPLAGAMVVAVPFA